MPAVLSPAEQRAERRRKGDAILWSLLALAGLAAVTDERLLLAGATWRRLAPRAGRGLFDATTFQPGLEVGAAYRFDATRVRYINPDGDAVSPKAVHQQAATVAERAKDELADLAKRMTDGAISVEEWQTQTSEAVANVNTAIYTVGRGGVDQMDDAAREAAAELNEFHIDKLNDFAVKVAEGEVSDAAAIARARLYPAGALNSYDKGDIDAWKATGLDVEESNVLADADHCQRDPRRPELPSCPELTAYGWVGLGDLPSPGRRVCGPSCLCRIARRVRTA